MISRTSLHAIRAMVALAELPDGEYAGAGSIADAIGAPPNYLGKLLQLLSKSGLVESLKGLGGGFKLGYDPSIITLLEVVEPIEHVSRWNDCILGHAACDEKTPCKLHKRWKSVRERYLELLAETTIAELMQKPKRKRRTKKS